MKTLLLLTAASVIALATPAIAQTMDHSNMPGMKMPAKPAPAAKPKPAAKPRAAAPQRPAPRAAQNKPKAAPAAEACPAEHAAMGHCKPEAAAPPQTSEPGADPEQRVGGAQDPAPSPADPNCPPEHAEMGHCVPQAAGAPKPGGAMQDMAMPTEDAMGSLGTALPAGDAPAPAAPEPNYADRVWGRDAMSVARSELRREHGGGTFSQVMIDIAELQIRDGKEGYRWEGEGWFGGDINRLVVKTEGEGTFGEPIEGAEVQALYSRAIGPYFNLQGGVRHDFEPKARSYAVFGVEGLAPYWFEVEAHGFVSTQGDVLGTVAASYDQRITQRLILQPRAEFNLAAQDVPESGIGAGFSDAELDLRLRYEIAREFAPYVGISYSAKFGRTADFARAAGEGASSTSLVFGIRAWF
ncbi:copper resistance protein B [Sphingomonas aestuarii]